MPRLKVPSVQHLSRNWHPNADVIKNGLVRLVRNPPRRSYDCMFSAVEDLLLLRQPYEQVAEGLRRGIRSESLRDDCLSILLLLREHFVNVSPDYYQAVARRYYPAAREILVPFKPPVIYGVNGTLYFPWFSFWRRNPLVSKRLSLFASLVDDILLQDPDLESANFTILDFSAPFSDAARELCVVDAASIPRLSKEDLAEMLSVFAKGYAMAKAELEGAPAADSRPDASSDEDDQPDMFDDFEDR